MATNLSNDPVNILRYTETPGFDGEVEWRIDPEGAWVRFDDVWPELLELRTKARNLLNAVDAKQAKIDALMQEFCPGEMSAEQRQRWEDHQVPVSAEEEAELLSALKETP